MRDRAVVIGAGPGGLAAAILLAASGLQVTVLERQPRVGGRTATLEAGGFRFDLGPTFFLYPAVLEQIFATAGYDLHREVSLVRLDPQYRLVFGEGGALQATPDLDRMEREVAALSPGDAGSLRRFLDDNRDKLARFRSCIESPFRAMTRLVPDRLRRRWADRKLETKKFSCSTFMLYLGIEGTYEHVPHHTIYIARNYEQNLDDIENRHTLSDDPSFYVQNAGVTDPTLAPKGMSTLYVLVPVTHQHPNVDWRRERERYRDLALSKLPQVGIEGVERRIRTERVVTPADWDQGMEIHRGATFNLAHNLGQMLHLRPRNRFEDLEGVYLVGGGTHPGSGLPVIFQSALISAQLLLEDLGIRLRQPADPALLRRPAEAELAKAV
jgi:phytoene dehydrogenase-like protein